jgi:hypothetical protein
MQTSKMICCIALAALSFQSAETKAQETPQVKPGDRVRVTAPECQLKRQKGTLISLDQNLFSATVGNEDIECPVEALTEVQVSVGKRKWWKASLGGMGVGVGMMFVMGAYSEPGEFGDKNSLIAVSLAPIGLVTGTVVGLIRGKDSWEEVNLLPIRPSLQVSAHGRLGFGLTVPLRR